jgi:hypothetical protein
LAAGKGGVWNNTAFIDRMKVSGIPGRFFFDTEKAAVRETGTEGQPGQNQKSLCLLLFYVRYNQHWFMLEKGELYQDLITDHKNLL